MGYTTDFKGQFNLNKPLTPEDRTFLLNFSETRRMARNVEPKYGVEGEFYVDGGGSFGQERDASIIDYNRPPRTQPGLWCHWVPTENGNGLGWNGTEKFYYYVEWLEYIIKNFLAPKGYMLSGTVEFQGEDVVDHGWIVVKDNVVSLVRAVAPKI